jgi:hypothetical protein
MACRGEFRCGKAPASELLCGNGWLETGKLHGSLEVERDGESVHLASTMDTICIDITLNATLITNFLPHGISERHPGLFMNEFAAAVFFSCLMLHFSQRG